MVVIVSRDITYWLVRKIGVGRAEYYCLTKSGDAATTENPKMAMRWPERKPAKDFARGLGHWWLAVAVVFPGDELCGMSYRIPAN